MASASYNQTQSSTASTSTSTRWDVFLSFRGIDTRFTFTDHLYNALHRNGIRTFRDDPELRSGEVISDALLQAIQKSKTYVIVLSENYASSRWCLDELVEILNCYNTMQRLVIPVFYNIDPSAVGYQTGSFKEAFEKHETRFDRERLDKWRIALTTMGKLSGKVCKNMSEANIIEEISDEILLEINPKTLDVAMYAVGLGPRVQEITSLLGSCTDCVIKIGIYGMGGVGKTTLAKALYNQLLLQSFKGCCYLANVREVSGTTKGLQSLQKQLISDVLKNNEKVKVHNVEKGTMLIRERICSAKILVLVDDIDDFNQYKSLVGPFASGSVVIITTRDEEILDKIKVEPRYRYRVNELDDAESLALFTQHAFGNANPDSILKVLSTYILRLAGGLPLALKVFGSYLSTQAEVGWKSYIEKLQRNPNTTIQQKLIISLNAVELDDPMLKKMFLDIACCLIGRSKEKVVKILGSYYSYADHNIDILLKRSLVTIDEKKTLGMHDLLRDMGREIVRNNSLDPGKHSILWASEDICNVLKNDKGTQAIEVISYDLEDYTETSGLSFAMETFKPMSQLRFLCVDGINLSGSFEQTLKNLRWLCWRYCPLKCLPSEFHPRTLVVLELRHSNMIQMWELDMASPVFENLKTLDMSYSYELITTSDLTKVPNLETLNLKQCFSMVELHISIGSLTRLVSLNLECCQNLRSLPDTICNLRALENLNINRCYSLEALPVELGNIESLKNLTARGLSVSGLPDSIGHLSKLVELTLENNCKLKALPDTLCNLRSLQVLNISGCEKLEILPTQLWKITSLKELYAAGVTGLKILPDMESRKIAISLKKLCLSKNVFTALPLGLSQLSKLKYLDLTGCGNLLSIAELPPNLKHIKSDGCKSMEKLPNLSNLLRLEILILEDCNRLKEMQGLEGLTSISFLHLGGGCTSYLAESLFQIYSGFERHITIYLPSAEFPGWISQSRDWTQSDLGSPISLDFPLNVSDNFLAMILCFENFGNGFHSPTYCVKNTTSDSIVCRGFYSYEHEAQIMILPRSIFSVKGDDRIELTATTRIIGIRLLYKTEIVIVDKYDSTTVKERIHLCKRLKSQTGKGSISQEMAAPEP